MGSQRRILITGGAGFIGSHVVNHFVEKYPEYKIYVLDLCTYASDMSNIKVLDKVEFITDDIRDADMLDHLFSQVDFTDIIHLAAESHVDNSIHDPNVFVETNVMGTVNLLNVAKDYWGENNEENRFYHISTDEVYGDLKAYDSPFTESTPYDPSSPYSASKAASDHFVRAYGRTYGMNYVISNCSNNYGPHQHREKLIPTVIRSLVLGKEIPVYGTGENIRDWLWVGDHVNAIDTIFHKGRNGYTYNVGGDNEISNIELVEKICDLYLAMYEEEFIEAYVKNFNGKLVRPIKFVTDRKGHDFRYAVNSNLLQVSLKWQPKKDFDYGLLETIDYYVERFSERND